MTAHADPPRRSPETVVRRFRAADAVAAAQIFFDAVHIGAKSHYDADQRRAWGGDAPDPQAWLERLTPLNAFVAQRDGIVVGFMTIAADGLIDLAFVSPAVMGDGVAWHLYRRIEQEARRLGARRLHAEASFLAKPFFERQGWSVITPQAVSRRGVTLTNYLMEKVFD